MTGVANNTETGPKSLANDYAVRGGFTYHLRVFAAPFLVSVGCRLSAHGLHGSGGLQLYLIGSPRHRRWRTETAAGRRGWMGVPAISCTNVLWPGSLRFVLYAGTLSFQENMRHGQRKIGLRVGMLLTCSGLPCRDGQIAARSYRL